nr:hypothetical protein [Kibdelosporangium sp. MJ126-NF4]CEL19136.1 hypothetical protein [Kibdelosporangium sp. MJ126-NF4]CTQ95062.1 hypothetical protein [Kibdelosporangium sp. MJ126-NF4]
MIDDRTEAREILGLMIGDEPPVSTTSAALVGKARRRQVIARSAVFGGVAMGVVGMLFFTALARPGPQPAEEVSVAAQPSTRSSGGVTAREINCKQDEPCPEWGREEDDRSRALTGALQQGQGQFVPAGLVVRFNKMSARPWIGGREEPFLFLHMTGDETYKGAYLGSAYIGNDSTGFGRVGVQVNDKGTDGTCASADPAAWEVRNPHAQNEKTLEFVGCTDENLPGGTVAAVARYEGRNSGGYTTNAGYRKTIVFAKKPDGTRVRVDVDNAAPDSAQTGYTHTSTTVPLTDQDIFKMIQLQGVKW